MRTVTRDASGRITGTATTRAGGGTTTRTDYRDAGGRLTGSATTQGHAHSNSSRTTYRDASGRVAGSADTGKAVGTVTRTRFRDASGRLTGSQTTSGSPSGLSTMGYSLLPSAPLFHPGPFDLAGAL